MNVRVGLRILSLAVVLAMVAGCPAPVFIPDKGLDAAIRAELHKPLGFLTEADLLEVTSLDARGLSIETLQGIEYCRNLQWLDLANNQVSNLKPLEQLGRPESPFDSPLVYLNLDTNDVTDITPLAGLMNLQGLVLYGNNVADVSPLVTNAQYGGLGEGDYVVFDYDTLSDKAVTVDIPLLQSYGVDCMAAVPVDRK